MRKLLGLVCAGAVVAMMNGCGLVNPVSGPTITISAIGSINAGTYKDVIGNIKADDAITSVSYSITTSTGAAVSNTVITPSGPSASNTKSMDFNTTTELRITVATTAANGSYKLVISATAGATSESSFDFTVGGSTGTPVTTYNLVAGANQNATLGSSIDLDVPKVMLMAEANANVSSIDLCYAYSGTSNVEKLFSPTQAKASGFTFAAGWASPNATKFAKLTMTVADYNAITTKEQILALTQPTTDGLSITCAANDVFIAITDQGAAVLMLITAQTPGATGSINLKIAK